VFSELNVPVIVAPMAGGVSTPALAAAASEAGGFGFLAAGYLTSEGLAEQISVTRTLTSRRFGVNLFVPGEKSTADTNAYQHRMLGVAGRYGVHPGDPKWDDDDYPGKLETVIAAGVPVVSFAFGLPAASDLARLRSVGTRVVVTVTTPGEARQAAASGVDALCLQGFEAGAHRGGFTDDGGNPPGGETYGLLSLLRLVRSEVDLPLVAAGGLVHGADVAAVLTAGAEAAQCGTAFLLASEAGTQQAHRDAIAAGGRPTRLTRAFSGKPARGLVNRFMAEHTDFAPAAYPQLHHLTRPIRGAAARAGDPEGMSLWAGQTYPLATADSTAEIMERISGEMDKAISGMRR
jgi:nitronate monooxygenase